VIAIKAFIEVIFCFLTDEENFVIDKGANGAYNTPVKIGKLRKRRH
jgi:hypothetical protein